MKGRNWSNTESLRFSLRSGDKSRWQRRTIKVGENRGASAQFELRPTKRLESRIYGETREMKRNNSSSSRAPAVCCRHWKRITPNRRRGLSFARRSCVPPCTCTKLTLPSLTIPLRLRKKLLSPIRFCSNPFSFSAES